MSKSTSSKLVVNLMRVAIVAACGLFVGAGSPRQTTAPAEIVGDYKVELRGFLTGSGQASVATNSVTITALVRDESGNAPFLRATALPLKDLRFSGEGTVAGTPVSIWGRIDPPGEVLETARLICSVDNAQGKRGRIVGARVQ